MEIQHDYSDKSFVVRGDTKPFKDQLKALGGKYNPKLIGGAGWIFSNTKKKAVKKFIDGQQEAEALVETLLESEEKPKQKRTLSSMTKQDCDKFRKDETVNPLTGGKLTVGKGPHQKISKKCDELEKQQSKSSTKKSPRVSPKASPKKSPRVSPKASPKKSVSISSNKITLDFPNRFTAGDGVEYQILIYSLPVPVVGKHVDVVIKGKKYRHTIVEAKARRETGVFDKATIEDQKGEKLIMYVTAGKWRAHYEDDNTVLFHA